MVDAIEAEYTCRQGGSWEGETFEFVSSEGVGYWANFEVKSQLRSAPEGTVVHEFDLSAAAVTNRVGSGVLTVGLFMLPVDTETLAPGIYRGDLWLLSDLQPKDYFILFTLTVLDRITSEDP